MAKTKIEWTATPLPSGATAPGYTWNCWRGCAKVSAGCAHCYAEALSRRNPAVLGQWGPGGRRTAASETYWRKPGRLDRLAAEAGHRLKVFSLSLGDWLEDWPGPVHDTLGRPLYRDTTDPLAPWVPEYRTGAGLAPVTLTDLRGRLLQTIHETPHLDWLLLTKRPEGWSDRLHGVAHGASGLGAAVAAAWLDGAAPPNVWVGASVEDHSVLGRISFLMDIPARLRFLSLEPLLADVTALARPIGRLDRFVAAEPGHSVPVESYPFEGLKAIPDHDWESGAIGWVIAGGESGPRARPCALAWFRSLRDLCARARVPFFLKQLGAAPHDRHGAGHEHRLALRDRAGADPAEWPEDLRGCRAWPEAVWIEHQPGGTS